MALNCSHRPIFPTHIPKDSLVVNGYFMEGGKCDERGESFAWPRHVSGGCEDCFDYRSERVERYASPDFEDIVNLLPSDPFGMDLSTTMTAITGWLEDLKVDCGGYGRNHVGPSNGDYDLFTDLSCMWKGAMRFPSSNIQFDGKRNGADPINVCAGERDMRDVMAHYDLGSACNVSEVVGFGKSDTCGEGAGDASSCSGEDEGIPHQALFFALGYLGVKDLLNVERVCWSLWSSVAYDPLLWRNIHIEKPLNEISDDALLLLTSRAEGTLQSLSLLECIRITDDGLKRVLEDNPSLTKLSVSACTRLSIDGIVNMLRSFNSNRDRTGIKHLRIGGLYGATHEHIKELKGLLGADSQMERNIHKPHFFTRSSLYCLGDETQALDVQACPRCENVGLVYDCPSEGCRVKDQGVTQECRACSVCIIRCIECGRCINNTEFEETFCLEFLCSKCYQLHFTSEDEEEPVKKSQVMAPKE